MNKHISKIDISAFCILATIFVISTIVTPYPMSWLVKLLPMILLIILAMKTLGSTKSSKFFILGLIFSAGGDFILDYDRQNWFIFGLGAFFIAHLFYLASLKPLVKSLKKPQYLLIFTMYVGYGAGMLWLLFDGLGQLFLPVVAYMSILLLMALATVLSKRSNTWLVMGGLSFVLSDSLIGFDKFYMPVENVHLAIMVSYYFAQFALFVGFLSSTNKALNQATKKAV